MVGAHKNMCSAINFFQQIQIFTHHTPETHWKNRGGGAYFVRNGLHKKTIVL